MLGLIGKKVGMTQVFDEQGAQTPVTVIEIEPNVVIEERTPEKHGYSAVVLGYGTRKKSRVRKPYAGQFPEGIAPTQVLKPDFTHHSVTRHYLSSFIFKLSLIQETFIFHESTRPV